MEEKGREIREAAGASRRASQGFPGCVCVVAAGLWTPCRVCLCASHQERQVGVEPGPRRRQEPREDPGEVWAAPDRPLPGRALGTGGAVARRAHSREGEPGVFPEVPSQQCIPAATPGSRDCLGAAGGGDTERRRRPLGPRVRGAREAEREAGRPRASVRAWPESCGAEDPRPELPAWPLARSQRRCCTDTHPPSSIECPRAPAAPAGRRRASGSGI